ncbi:uncharacterized protein LOC132937322 isoform X1 [Metopolophium dirhodum]|uniref:uncharacterized protein LOC132937322 isoform X1 n=1 Tax=Metopolophium dirhodum TaxID=44670 RepID=UPI00298FF709|nr:uncharacterized protein LOC132937322 isoform X1 [Metopolophium dirhodum]
MDRTVQNNTAQEKRQQLKSLKRFTQYGNDIKEMADFYFKSRRIADDDSELMIDLDQIDYYLLMDDGEKLLEDVLAPQDSDRENLLQQYYKEDAAKALEAIKIEMQGDFKKNNLDSDVSDDDKERVATANNKLGNNDTVESYKEKNDEEDYTKGKRAKNHLNLNLISILKVLFLKPLKDVERKL